MSPHTRSLTVLMATVLTAVVVAPPVAAGDDDELPVNAKLVSKFPAEGSSDGVSGDKIYHSTVKVRLAEGQRVTFTASATGDGRKLAIVLANPDGKAIRSNFPGQYGLASGATAWKSFNSAVITGANFGQSMELASGAVASDGVYTLHVISNESGTFDLIAKDTRTPRDAAAVEKELAQAEEKVAALKRELEALRKKK